MIDELEFHVTGELPTKIPVQLIKPPTGTTFTIVNIPLNDPKFVYELRKEAIKKSRERGNKAFFMDVYFTLAMTLDHLYCKLVASEVENAKTPKLRCSFCETDDNTVKLYEGVIIGGQPQDSILCDDCYFEMEDR